MNSVTIDSLLFALVGIMFVGLSVPLIRERIPPNRFYGFRTAKTLSDPHVWYRINHISGKDLFIAGSLITITSVTMLLLAQRWSPEHVVATLLSVMVLSLVGVAWHGFAVLRRM